MQAATAVELESTSNHRAVQPWIVRWSAPPLLWVPSILGCGPDEATTFAGSYHVESAGYFCGIDDEQGFGGATLLSNGFEIIDNRDGSLALDVYMPPCSTIGIVDGDELRLDIEDCTVDVDATPWHDAFSIESYDAFGLGVWNGGELRLTVETTRRYTSIPTPNLPHWWDDPGTCETDYALTPR